MPQTFYLKKGFNIPLVGRALLEEHEISQPNSFAVKPSDFKGGVQPKLLVSVGENVKAGDPLFFDKVREEVLFVAPVSGEISEIIRGERRKIIEIRILADKEIEYKTFKKYTKTEINNLTRAEAIAALTVGGIWPSFIQRPFGVLANPSDEPSAIYISAFDSNPCAPDMAYLLRGKEGVFQLGIAILSKLAKGNIHVNLDASEIPSVFSGLEQVNINKFSGPHPAGNVGVQIHHIKPIGKNDKVWTIDPLSVARTGTLFMEGIYDASKLIAITGSEIIHPHYVKTYSGACLDKLVVENFKKTNARFISGNVLSGEHVGVRGYLGHFHNQISVIPEGDEEGVLGWMLPSFEKLSFHKAFGLFSFLIPKKEKVLDTNTNGEQRNFTISGAFEKILPMDILPTYLFKSIISNDYDEMEALGIYEVIEEDVALCEYIDVSKNDIQAIVREGIELIRNS